MQQTTILLSDELRKQIEELALHQHREPAEVLEDAVRRYAANYRLDRLSETLGRRPREKGIREENIPALVKEARRENEAREQ